MDRRSAVVNRDRTFAVLASRALMRTRVSCLAVAINDRQKPKTLAKGKPLATLPLPNEFMVFLD
jgi:hypothetical protein